MSAIGSSTVQLRLSKSPARVAVAGTVPVRRDRVPPTDAYVLVEILRVHADSMEGNCHDPSTTSGCGRYKRTR
jgi:hypothetical protein